MIDSASASFPMNKKRWKLIIHRWTILWDWRQMLTTVFSLDKILKFSKVLILEFSDSPTQILVFFLSRKTVGQVTQT